MRRLPMFACSAVLALGLSGCLQPTPLNIASFMFDAGSYAVSGKTLVDHGVSGITQQDCAVSRLITEGALCRERVIYAAAPEILEPLPARRSDAAQAARPGRVPSAALTTETRNGGYLKSALPVARSPGGPAKGRSQIAGRAFLRSPLEQL